MSGRKNRAAHVADGGGKAFALLPHAVLESPAYRTASYRARAVLTAIVARFNGFNNGRICISSKELAIELGCQNYSSNSEAVGELISRGLIVLEKSWPRGVRKSHEYRLTFVSSGPDGKVRSATNEYRPWQPGDAGTRVGRFVGKKRLATVATETGVSSAVTTTEGKLSTAVAATETLPINGKAPNFPLPSLATVTAHIGSHRGGSRSDPSITLKTAGGPHDEKSRVITCAPSTDELRGRAQSYISKHGRGSQGLLATKAGILGGTFSKFLNNDGPLNEHARVRLACAFPRAEAAAAKNERAA